MHLMYLTRAPKSRCFAFLVSSNLLPPLTSKCTRPQNFSISPLKNPTLPWDHNGPAHSQVKKKKKKKKKKACKTQSPCIHDALHVTVSCTLPGVDPNNFNVCNTVSVVAMVFCFITNIVLFECMYLCALRACLYVCEREGGRERERVAM